MTDRLQAVFTGYTETEINAQTDDLLAKSTHIRTNGWDLDAETWARGSILAVALVLDDEAPLRNQGFTTDQALSRMAYFMYGIAGGKAEEANGFRHTRRYFSDVAERLNAQPAH